MKYFIIFIAYGLFFFSGNSSQANPQMHSGGASEIISNGNYTSNNQTDEVKQFYNLLSNSRISWYFEEYDYRFVKEYFDLCNNGQFYYRFEERVRGWGISPDEDYGTWDVGINNGTVVLFLYFQNRDSKKYELQYNGEKISVGSRWYFIKKAGQENGPNCY